MEPLPTEILFHELLPLLDLSSLISFFSVSQATRRLSTEMSFWLEYVGDSDDQPTQQLFIDWSRNNSGRLSNVLYRLCMTLMPNLDARTVMVVTMGFVERRDKESVRALQEAAKTNYCPQEVSWAYLDYLPYSLDLAAIIVRKVRINDSSSNIKLLCEGLLSICRYIDLYDYLIERITLALSQDQLTLFNKTMGLRGQKDRLNSLTGPITSGKNVS